MSGRLTLLCTALGRVAAGMAVMAAGLLVAPVAAADPIGDANAAITASYDASGGPTGPLGAREGDVYPVGAGFGQNFAAGKMFFTPDTGAHFMQGAVLEKYESLGGPADSDLGFPTIDEGPGRVGPDSRNVTFSAADRPVIFWTPATGARVVRGAINAAWDKLGGSAGQLGVPAEDEMYRGDVVSQKFTGGEISWNRKDKTFTTVPPELAGQLADVEVPEDATSAIAAARRAAGGALGPLGAADGPQYPIGDDGVGQNYAGGKIFYSPETGANVVTGQVLEKYESVGGPEGVLGFPTSSETDGGLGSNSRVSSFAAEDRPVIFWTPDYGPVIVRGAMNAAWEKLDAAEGPLGAPMADATENGSVISQRFSGGVVSYDRTTGKFTTEPANLATALAGLEVPGADVPQNTPGATPQASDEGVQWNRWWLLALIPILILAALAAGAIVMGRHRARRDDRRFDDDYYPAPDDGGRYVPVAAGVPDARDDTGDGDPDRFAGDYAPAPALFGDPDRPQADETDLWNMRDQPAVDGRFAPAPGADDHPEDSPVQRDHDRDVDLVDPEEDPDSVDTAPTRIESVEPDLPGPMFVEDAPSGRHAAIEVDEPSPGRTAVHIGSDGTGGAPEGYPVKADTRSGLYWVPGSRHYEDAVAEIWFASEEFARTNGFVRGD
ncbi:LGFP repeat-containing protein [Mycolicibacterium sp. S2-37]|uniref:LGFP repeat-containing protein n=1 Tax=Mycolicibacterium sp. S2-37 TaxID=2810297 RepID=UPI001A94EC2B|nr:LGFP repeat-containing protein [Mycolicibacterium sp. S2-37]MBO0677001.1 LGFP repeat-containing protein [Mycolicibacterium sp. S2-37]